MRIHMNTTKSEELYKIALDLMPGGVNSPVRAFGSVGRNPLFIDHAKGAYVYDVDGNKINLPGDAKTFAVSFAGYDRTKGSDDIVYLVLNINWTDVEITLPPLKNGSWYLCVNTWGDGSGRYCYEDAQQTRIDSHFIMRPRSVAVFVGRQF